MGRLGQAIPGRRQVEAELDRRERVANLVGHAGRDPAERSEALVLCQLALQLLGGIARGEQIGSQAGDPAGDAVELGEARARHGRGQVLPERRQRGLEHPEVPAEGDRAVQ